MAADNSEATWDEWLLHLHLRSFLFIHQQCTCLQFNNGPELWWLWDSSFYQLRPQGLADSFLIASVSEEDSILFSHKLFPPLEGTTVYKAACPKWGLSGDSEVKLGSQRKRWTSLIGTKEKSKLASHIIIETHWKMRTRTIKQTKKPPNEHKVRG